MSGPAVQVGAAIPRDALVALYDAVGWRAYTVDPARLEAGVAASGWVGAVWAGGALIGLCRALTDRATIVYVQDVLVHPDHQRQGVGRALIEACLAAHADLRQVVLLTDDRPEQHAFYAALGLVDTRDTRLHAFVRLR